MTSKELLKQDIDSLIVESIELDDELTQLLDSLGVIYDEGLYDKIKESYGI